MKTLTLKREFKPTASEAEIRAGWAHTFWAELGTGAVCLAMVVFWPAWSEGWAVAAIVEAALTMATLTLTDVATRLQKPPSILVGILIAGGVGLLYFSEVGFAFSVSTGEHQGGAPGWLGMLAAGWAIAQRARSVWTMPQGDALDRMRHRALVGDRAVVVGVLAVAALGIAFFGHYLLPERLISSQLAVFPLCYALLCFFTAARIPSLLGPKFAAKPKALIYDVLGVDYLARL